jgi:hypothetical protein
MRLLAPAVLVCLLGIMLPEAQNAGTTGDVAGVVIDEHNAGVPRAPVELLVDQRVERRTTTDAKGAFRFEHVRAGRYQLRVMVPGFVPLVARVDLGDKPVANLRLTLKMAAAQEQARVQATSPAVDAAKAIMADGRGGVFPAPPLPLVAQEFNTEAYDRIDENSFHRVADDPRSTFSIDVDTASYANVRRFLTEGTLPPADAVRVEELINYFRFGYKDPEDEQPFSVTTEVGSPGEPVDGGNVDPLKYQDSPRPNGAAHPGELMTVKLRYKQPDGDTSRLLAIAVRDGNGELTPNLGFAASVAEFGLLLRKSAFKGQATWSSAQHLARRYRGDDPDGYRAEFVRLLDLAAALDAQNHTSLQSRR